MSSFSTFPIMEQDDCIIIRAIGTFISKGVRLNVEMEAFSENEEGLKDDDYCSVFADIHVTSPDGVNLMDIFANDTISRDVLLEDLKAFLEATVDGRSDVGWGESGAQSAKLLAFGRNGW